MSSETSASTRFRTTGGTPRGADVLSPKALADFNRRRLWLDLGYPGLFLFLHRELGLSKGAAHFRKVAAELVQRFPEVVEPARMAVRPGPARPRQFSQ